MSHIRQQGGTITSCVVAKDTSNVRGVVVLENARPGTDIIRVPYDALLTENAGRMTSWGRDIVDKTHDVAYDFVLYLIFAVVQRMIEDPNDPYIISLPSFDILALLALVRAMCFRTAGDAFRISGKCVSRLWGTHFRMSRLFAVTALSESAKPTSWNARHGDRQAKLARPGSPDRQTLLGPRDNCTMIVTSDQAAGGAAFI